MSIMDRIRAHGGDIIRNEWRFSLRRGSLNDEAVAWVKAHMREIRREVWPAYDDWEERAAIREYDGGQDRAEAEAGAYGEYADV